MRGGIVMNDDKREKIHEIALTITSSKKHPFHVEQDDELRELGKHRDHGVSSLRVSCGPARGRL
jgi:hypothetical protein